LEIIRDAILEELERSKDRRVTSLTFSTKAQAAPNDDSEGKVSLKTEDNGFQSCIKWPQDFFKTNFIRFAKYAVNMVNIKYYTKCGQSTWTRAPNRPQSLDKPLLEDLKGGTRKTTSCFGLRMPRRNILKAFSKTWCIQSAGTDSQGSAKKIAGIGRPVGSRQKPGS
jgi:hypothetical protein